ETSPVRATASAYFRYVSMDATTTRASTVIRSIPTREIRTQASITMPLSKTRSSTSIRLEPPETRSTAIGQPPTAHKFIQAYPARNRVVSDASARLELAEPVP